MGNIKHNDELLRVHDDGFDVVFNCDNKHQNGVSYHAEKSGKKTKIDPEYAMAALVKKISEGGGTSDPDEILENAKETGGIGYTENGEQTVITWDGDTEGRVGIEGHAYKISELTPTIEEVIGGVIDTKSQDDGILSVEITADSITTVSEHLYSVQGFGQSSVIVALEDGEIEGITFEHGVYYSKDGSGASSVYVTSLTYGAPDTIHKIDEKYLPEGSGGWPEDMPVPSVGGYGYTEQDEQTIFDGTVSYAAGGEAQELTHEYDLVEGQSYNVTFNGTEYNNLVAFNDGGYISIGAAYSSGYDVYPFHIENAEVEYVGEGICFYTEMPGDYSLVITTNEEVVHKINEQYLPSGSGGVLVVTMTVDENNHVISPYTPEEVITAMQTMPVYCVIESTISPVTICGMFMMKGGRPGPSPILRMNFGDDDMTVLSADSEGWVFSV